MKLEAWWVCSHCGKPLVQLGKGGFQTFIREHRKTCSPAAGGTMKQIEQGKAGKCR